MNNVSNFFSCNTYFMTACLLLHFMALFFYLSFVMMEKSVLHGIAWQLTLQEEAEKTVSALLLTFPSLMTL